MPAGPAVDDVIAWLDFRAWGAAIAFSPSRQREGEATHGFFYSSATRKDADSAAVASASVERWVVGVRFVQRFAALDIILQSLYHALCTFCTFQGRANVDF